MIKEFQGEFSFLSNFHPCSIKLFGLVFPSSEHIFMSGKNHSDEWVLKCASNEYTPGQIKRLSQKVDLIPNWDKLKFEWMKYCVYLKFNQNEELKQKLIATGNEELVEGNWWNDKIWGVCLKTGVGENHLGKILMEVREELR